MKKSNVGKTSNLQKIKITDFEIFVLWTSRIYNLINKRLGNLKDIPKMDEEVRL